MLKCHVILIVSIQRPERLAPCLAICYWRLGPQFGRARPSSYCDSYYFRDYLDDSRYRWLESWLRWLTAQITSDLNWVGLALKGIRFYLRPGLTALKLYLDLFRMTWDLTWWLATQVAWDLACLGRLLAEMTWELTWIGLSWTCPKDFRDELDNLQLKCPETWLGLLKLEWLGTWLGNNLKDFRLDFSLTLTRDLSQITFWFSWLESWLRQLQSQMTRDLTWTFPQWFRFWFETWSNRHETWLGFALKYFKQLCIIVERISVPLEDVAKFAGEVKC